MTWPVPFSGISRSVSFGSQEALSDFLQYVADGCGRGHMHNIAVEFDAERPKVYGSTLLAECAERWSELGDDDL